MNPQVLIYHGRSVFTTTAKPAASMVDVCVGVFLCVRVRMCCVCVCVCVCVCM